MQHPPSDKARQIRNREMMQQIYAADIACAETISSTGPNSVPLEGLGQVKFTSISWACG